MLYVTFLLPVVPLIVSTADTRVLYNSPSHDMSFNQVVFRVFVILRVLNERLIFQIAGMDTLQPDERPSRYV